MRNQCVDSLLLISKNPRTVFMTGDLGFMAFEELKAHLGPRFINAGIAEQNMVSVAAGMAKEGLSPWVYSIAPFIFARAFEQIRNDVCFHCLPVKLIGNGGGYGYGVMGPSHHALEDYGAMSLMPNIRIFIPVFNNDLAPIMAIMDEVQQPTYLRLSKEYSSSCPASNTYSPWRKLLSGSGPVIFSVGAIAASFLLEALKVPISSRPSIWAISELPLNNNPPPSEVLKIVDSGIPMHIVEDHVRQGSFGLDFLAYLAYVGIAPNLGSHIVARHSSFATYGSQEYMHQQVGLDPSSILRSFF